MRTLLLECAGLDPRHASRDEHMLFSQQASRDLVRNLAHEIKNPLGGIRGAAQLLEREFPDSEHREFTRVIIREVDRLQALVNRLLGPDRAPRKQQLNIHEVLEDVRRLLEAEAARTGRVAIIRDYDPSLPDLTADRGQLVQALLNIVATPCRRCRPPATRAALSCAPARAGGSASPGARTAWPWRWKSKTTAPASHPCCRTRSSFRW